MYQGFKFKNPHEKSSCGCGSVALKARRRKQDVSVPDDEEWRPGTVGFVELTIDSTSLSGNRKVFLRITSNAQEEELVLQASGSINAAFSGSGQSGRNVWPVGGNGRAGSR